MIDVQAHTVELEHHPARPGRPATPQERPGLQVHPARQDRRLINQPLVHPWVGRKLYLLLIFCKVHNITDPTSSPDEALSCDQSTQTGCKKTFKTKPLRFSLQKKP